MHSDPHAAANKGTSPSANAAAPADTACKGELEHLDNGFGIVFGCQLFSARAQECVYDLEL